MQQKKKGELKSSNWRFIIAASTAVFLICVVSIAWFYTFLQDKLFAERQAFFTQFAEKTAENIDLAIDDFWHRSQICQEFISFDAPTDEKALISALAYCSETINAGQAVVIAFTESGEFYSSDGHTGWFGIDNSISFVSDAAARQTAIVNLPYESTESTYFLLFANMGNPLEVPGEGIITHLALAIDVKSLQEIFATHGFGDSCHTYFVTDMGRKLYQSDDSHHFIEGYNILSALEGSAEVIGGGSMDDLLTSFELGDTTAFEISHQGEEWFVSFQTVASGDHRLIVFAPTDLIGNNAAILSQSSFWFLLFICLLLGLLFVIVALSVLAMLGKLREVNGLLEQEAQAADQANRAKSEFLSYMSHDIRTPINGIMGMTGIAMRNKDDHEKVMNCLGKIEEASGHLLSLVNDMLDLSRIEQGKTAIVCEPVFLPSLLEECSSIIEGQLSTRNLVFEHDFGDMPYPHVFTDELHLRQILINILGNAVKFTPDGGCVSFRAHQKIINDKSIELLFEVEDTGIGMDEAYLLHIWEPFSQSRQGQCSTYEGTGLGMAITKRFVDMMEGDISVKSQLGQGSTFTVRLTVDIDEHGEQRYQTEEAEGDLTGLKVLLVEDKELNREIAREILQDVGAQVTCAEDGLEALEVFSNSPEHSFDVILMDVMMPVMDGLEATRRIRVADHPEAASIPIVALTAHAFEEDVHKTLEAGMNAHLSKPIISRDLIRALAPYRTRSYDIASHGTLHQGKALAACHILLAEDDFINMEVSKAILEECGAFVVPAEDGQQALDAFKQSPDSFFDVILLDVHMPIMGGLETAKSIRSLKRSDAHTVPIFALTADFAPEERQDMELAGVEGVLLKPLDIDLLVEEIAKAKQRENQHKQ